MMRLETVLLAVFALVGVAAAWSGYDMGLTQFNKPGPGLFPFLIGVLLAILSVPALVGRLGARPAGPGPAATLAEARHWSREAAVTLSFGVYAAALPHLGFALSSVVFVFFLLCFVGGRGWLFSLVASAGIVAPLVVVFDLVLKVRLPRSSLF